MIQVVPFLSHHVNDLIPYMSLLQVHDPLDYGIMLAADSYSFSGVRDGKVIGAAGIHPIHSGVGQAWALLSPDIRKEKFFLHRECKRRIYSAIELGLFHRIEIIVDAKFKEAIQWAGVLGFRYEGTRHMYGPDGSDYFSYAITK